MGSAEAIDGLEWVPDGNYPGSAGRFFKQLMV